MQNFSLRTEILRAFHNWSLILVCIFIGSGAGWLYNQTRAPLIQAETQLYVALNPYRAPEDSNAAGFASFQFLNDDDYKNWQLSQLNAAALSDAFLQETLSRLQSDSTDWKDIDIENLRGRVSLSWRNTGTWRFTASGDEPDRLSKLAQTWAQVTAEKVQAAIQASQQVLYVDIQLQETAKAQTSLLLRQESLNAALASLQTWQQAIQNIPDGEPIEQEARNVFQAIISEVFQNEQTWQSKGITVPDKQAPVQEYQEVAGVISAHSYAELSQIEAQLAVLETETVNLRSQYEQYALSSWGFAPSLVVEEAIQQPPEITTSRTSAPAALTGGLLALVGWALYALWNASRSIKSNFDEPA